MKTPLLARIHLFSESGESVGPPPIVKHLRKQDSNSDGDQGHHLFEVSHPSLSQPARVKLTMYRYSKTKGEMSVVNSDSHGTNHMGNLGTRHNMHVLGRIKHHVPELERITGLRVTGARKGLHDVMKNTSMAVNVKHVKPIAP